MHDDTIERFTAAIDWLKKNRIILSQVEFAERAHFNPSQISEMLNGKRKISERTIHKISAAFPEISNAWLLTGEGEMLKHESPTELKSNTSIPFFDIDVTASIAEAFHDTPEIPQYYIDFPPLNDCTAAFPVFGESMEPDFFAGEVVLVKEITNVDSMLWGEPYLVITNANCDNLRTIKNVYLSEDRQYFILRATNPRYSGDTIISRNDVLKIFLVKGKVNRRQL